MIKIPIRITVMGLFLIIAAIIMSIMFYVQLNFSEDLAKKAMKDQFKVTSYKLKENINKINGISNSIITSTIPFISDKSADDFFLEKNKYLKIFSNILEENDNLYSIYIGFKDNRFFEIINLSINENLQKFYKSGKNGKWLIIEIKNNNEKTLSIYDNNFTLKSSKKEKSDFFVKQRPWYKKSIKSKDITKVGPYTFSNIEAKGITYSKNMKDSNVFALDILLNDFSKVFNTQGSNKEIESYLFNNKKNIIASTSSTHHIFNTFIKTIKINEVKQNRQFIVEIDSKSYIFNLMAIEGYGETEYLLSYVLLDKMMSTYIESFSEMDKIFMILFLVFLPILWYFASIIVKPILLLVEESKKVKNRDFNKIKTINSAVNEVNLLSTSMKVMANSIYEYQSELVQKVEMRTEELELINKKLEILSITDKLTNTYNRIKLDDTIEEKMKEANEDNGTFSVIIIDIDFFKQVNDTYGHQVGDVTLVEFTKILKDNLNSENILGRWGGEEFIIVSSSKDLSSLIQLANNLREKIEEHDFPTIGTKTASFGVSIYRKHETSEELINRADEALYIAKKNGRNRVETIEK